MHSAAVLEDREIKPPSAILRRSTSIVIVALVLWIASNIFVSGVAKISAWEGIGSYHRMADLCKWDCTWYASIVQIGYNRAAMTIEGQANWAFNPLFPMSAYPLHRWFKLSLGGSFVLASKLELLLAIYAFLLMLESELQSTSDLIKAGSLVAFNPYVIYAHAGYAEPLYFAMIALGLYFASRRQWLAAGVAGGLASAARVVGVVFAGSYLLAGLRAADWRARWRKLDLNFIIGLLLCPLGTALFMLYLHQHMGDALSLQHSHVAWGREVANPFRILWLSLLQHHWPRVWAAMMIAAWLAAGWLFVLRKPELGLYLAAALFLAFASPTPGYWGVARYVWWQPPFLYAIWRILRRIDSGWWTIYLAFAAGMAAFMVVEWFTGHNFVV